MDESLEIDLDPSEWDFRSIPQEELWLAVVYEFCREVPEVSNRVSEWLDGKFEERNCDYYDDPGSEYVLVGPLTVREVLIAHLDEVGLDEMGDEDYTPLPDETVVPSNLAGHPVLGICLFLIDWPKPYLVFREHHLFGKALESLQKRDLRALPPDEGLYPKGMLRSNNRLPCKLSGKKLPGEKGRTLGDWATHWDLPTYGFDIDMTFTRIEIVDAFKAWLKEEHERVGKQRPRAEKPGSGRKLGKRLPDASLRALAAHRLTKRGQTGKTRDREWVVEALKVHVKRTTIASKPFPSDTLPMLGEKGFREAVNRVEKIMGEFK